MIAWHRLFGLLLDELFRGSAWQVVVEMDLSRRIQRLDIVVVRRGDGPPPQELPDGFAPLADHNLITYKSLREPLDGWAIKELIGHSVNYRKQVSPSWDALIPEERIQLFAIATRFPQKLAEQVQLDRCGAGVYNLQWGTDRIRVLVLSEVPSAERNAIWNLFSGEATRIEAAVQQFRRRKSELSTILNQLFENYQQEGIPMPYTVEDFMRDVTLEHLDLLKADERLRGLSSDERLRGLSSDERLRGLSSDERLRGLSSDERLKGLSPEEIEAYLRKWRSGDPRRGMEGTP